MTAGVFVCPSSLHPLLPAALVVPVARKKLDMPGYSSLTDKGALADGEDGVIDCDPDKWRYRIEGGQKMVFFRTTPGEDLANVLCLYSAACPLPQGKPQPLFSKYLSHYLLNTSIVSLPSEFSRSLVRNARQNRPPNRPPHFVPHSRGTLQLDLAAYFGTESTTLVEIKPKSGVLSVSRLIPTELARTLGKFTTPTYHVKNYLTKTGVIPKHPYCPADMLSGNKTRMFEAVAALQRERARTLRAFSAGSVIDAEAANRMVQAAVAALEHDGVAVHRVRKIQEEDVLDISGAATVMKILAERVGTLEAETLVASAARGESNVTEVSEQDITQARRDIAYSSPEEGARNHCESQRMTALKKLHEMSDALLVRLAADFLQAAAAKDCSLMIAMCRKEDYLSGQRQLADDRMVAFDGVEWVYRVWAVDVEQKDVDKITSRWPKEERRREALLRNRTLG